MGMSESALRAYAETRGHPVTHAQFGSYLRAGLLPEPTDGRWPEAVGDRLVLVRKLGQFVRPLPRRVILLRDHINFPVAPEKLRQAMIALIPTIRTPIAKMKRVDAAVTYWAHLEANRGAPIIGDSLPHGWRPPSPERWIEILQGTDNITHAFPREGETPDQFTEKERVAREMCLKYFDDRAGMQYYAIQYALTVSIAGTKYELDDMLEEEVITLLTIRDLATRETIREQARERERWQEQVREELEREERYYAERSGETAAE
jgi:hypothetical protein